ncbi:RNA polymerase sigma-70 factor [Labilibaculum sp. K2S]|uniref:RNA polymerase sigma-70 factor n=1 Tax=Labilibaculum sp. K2S TaxID=3056386 RepID=UPI0025A33D1C|nr:RNA polymerase sigma-70 factor [Labilibaculum sp. K2S]MDM8158340.1 RNA polymerase sigma-70 factor [Labilibaculum sp. K2S]
MTTEETIRSECINRTDFEALFNAHYSRLCAYAYNFLKEQEGSEEVVQEVFFKLWIHRHDIHIENSIESYLYRAVRNTSLNLIKHINIREKYKEHNQQEIEYSERLENDPMNASELELKIRSSIDLLPEQRRKIFILSRYEQLKYKEIADKLGISVKTVENQMGKALQFLRKELADYLPLLALFFYHFFNGE